MLRKLKVRGVESIADFSQALYNAVGVGLRQALDSKQSLLESGESIKTINGFSILGSGNIKLYTPSVVLIATETLSRGDFVNIHTAGVRRATATLVDGQAHGFVLEDVNTAQNATVMLAGINNAVTAQVAGVVFLQTQAGKAGSEAPVSGTGASVQKLGIAINPNAVLFSPELILQLA